MVTVFEPRTAASRPTRDKLEETARAKLASMVLAAILTLIVGGSAFGAPPQPSVNRSAATLQQRPRLPQDNFPQAPPTWDAYWAAAWQRAAYYYRIQAAPNTLKDPVCQGKLGLDLLARNTMQAIAWRKYGDAAFFLSQFQDRSLCLTREGARGVEFALSMYLHRALTQLPQQQAQIAVHGALNLGWQIFDQVQYTHSSWWLMTVNFDAGRIQAYMANYPRKEMGLWMYDFRNGLMVKSAVIDGMDRLLWSARSLNNFGRGNCSLLDMSTTGFSCLDRERGRGSGTGGPPPNDRGGAPSAPTGTLPPNDGACMLGTVSSAGVRGQLSCVGRAVGPIGVPLLLTTADFMKYGENQAGIHDKICARGEDADAAGDDAADDSSADSKSGGKSTWDQVKDAAGKVADAVGSLVDALFNKTPPVIDVLAQGATAEGADGVRGVLQADQAFTARQALLSDDENGYEKYDAQRNNRVTRDPQANQRLVDGNSAAGGACGGRGSNAAKRAQALFQCITGNEMLSGMQPGAITSGLDPRLTRTNPDETTGGPTMSCLIQGGDLVRRSPTDARCAVARCAAGEPCPCNNGGSLVSEPKTIIRPAQAEPDCMDGPCDATPAGSGGTQTTGGTITTGGSLQGSSTGTIGTRFGGPKPPSNGGQTPPPEPKPPPR